MRATLYTPTRREWMYWASLGLLGASSSGWLPQVAHALAGSPRRRRHCVLLWMAGGPSQTDTFDMKPGHAHGGEFREVATSVPGLRFSEHLPRLGQQADRLAIVRGVSTKEGDHGRGTYLMRTGQRPGAPVRYPSIGSSLSKALGDDDAPLPNYVAINPALAFSPEAFGPGFLGPRYAAATVGATDVFQVPQPAAGGDAGFAQLRVDNLTLPAGVTGSQAQRRRELWEALQSDFLARRAVLPAIAHDTVYRRAQRTMHSKEAEAFDLSQEATEVREAYGRGRFGQGCLIARRLIERGVPFVEVSLGEGIAWDTHQNNFETVKNLSAELDAGWATLMTELQDRGLLAQTTILWMGEFGRTPQINEQAGRDHFPNAWTCVYAGGGINGGQVYGKTSADGNEVTEGQVGVGDVLVTLCRALGVDPSTENISELGRPIKIAEGTPIEEILA